MFGRKAMAISKAGREKSETDIGDNPKTDKLDVDGCIIVYGRDDSGKAHASRFDKDIKQQSIRAAHVMGFHTLAVTHPAIKAIAEDLPEGRVFDSGKAFVPFVKSGVCIALEGHAKQFPSDVLELSEQQIEELARASEDNNPDEDTVGDEQQTNGNSEKGENSSGLEDGTNTKSDPPSDWVDVNVGTRVLAVDDPDDGWWEAKVKQVNRSGIGTNTGVVLTLQWVEYPDEPSFKRRSNEVAYFHPAYGQTFPDDESSSGNAYSKAKGKV